MPGLLNYLLKNKKKSNEKRTEYKSIRFPIAKEIKIVKQASANGFVLCKMRPKANIGEKRGFEKTVAQKNRWGSVSGRGRMAFERRGGNYYYYRKKRFCDRIGSQYVGSGVSAVMLENLDRLNRTKLEAERIKTRKIRAEMERFDEKLDEISSFNRDLVKAFFLINGFHQHKGVWRKIRKK